MTPPVPGVSSGIDDAVLQAADHLHIQIPDAIKGANSNFTTVNVTGDIQLMNPPDNWPAVMASWAKTSDYARACVAAFEATH